MGQESLLVPKLHPTDPTEKDPLLMCEDDMSIEICLVPKCRLAVVAGEVFESGVDSGMTGKVEFSFEVFLGALGASVRGGRTFLLRSVIRHEMATQG